MIPWETLGRGRAPDGGELVLYRRGGEYSIRVNGRELMSSRAHGSEERIAAVACDGLARTAGARVLVGGLGMGFTLRAALDALGSDAAVTICELLPEVVEWNRGPLGPLAGAPLEDPRVTVEIRDVGQLLRATTTRWHAIVLDVDNGPTALTRPGNQTLYGDQGLLLAKRSLARAGILAVWSAGPDVRFERRLARAGFQVQVIEVPARGSAGGPAHTIFVGRAP